VNKVVECNEDEDEDEGQELKPSLLILNFSSDRP
jgi:hypothetical protein